MNLSTENKIMDLENRLVVAKNTFVPQKMAHFQIPYDITYIWNLIYSTNELFHRKENHGLGE